MHHGDHRTPLAQGLLPEGLVSTEQPAIATTTTIRIRRSDGRATEHTVEAGQYTTILDALEQIRSEEDKSLLYRHSCHHGSCGTCGMIANGKRILACVTRLADLESPVMLEPLAPYPVIGDLAVDPSTLYAEFPHEASYLRPSESLPDAVPPEEVAGFTRFENCIECGLCESACPVIGAPGRPFKGPAALAAYGRELEKNPERAQELLTEVDTPSGVWGCDRALQCSMVCPMEVFPARHIAVLQRKARVRGDGGAGETTD
jgi:succinate dehydrogenase / fumarate reductase iron-sulfur subunit